MRGPVSTALRSKVGRAGLWMLLSKAAGEAARLVRVLVLARLLAPHDFGLMGIALFVLGCIEVFTEPGLNVALIQRQGDIRPYLNTVFTINAARGVVVALAIAGLAPLAARFWAAPEAMWVIAAVSLVVVLRGFTNPGAVYLTKELDFRTIFRWNFGEAAATLLTAVVAGLVWRNVWALVASAIAGQTVKTALSYRVHPFRPALGFDWSRAREVGSFSKWVLATNIVVYLGLHADSALVGKLVGVGALGLYEVAQRIAAVPRKTLTDVAAQVAYPAFSARQSEPATLRRLFLKMWTPLLAVNGVIALLVVAFPRTVLGILAGPKWLEASGVLAILAVAHFLRAAAVLPTVYFYAIGQPKLTFHVNLARGVVLIVCLWPLVRLFGVQGAAIASLAGAVAMTVVWVAPFMGHFHKGAASPSEQPVEAETAAVELR